MVNEVITSTWSEENPTYQVTMENQFWMVHPLSVDPQCGTCFISPFWHLEFWGGL